MVLVAKGRFFCNQNWIKRLFYSSLMDGSGCKRTVLCNHKPKEPSLCNQIWVNWLFDCLLVGDFFVGGDETKASDWLSGAFATVKKIVFYCFF